MEVKLIKLRGGAALVNPEERKAVEKLYLESISQWRKRKRMFKDLWDAITENSPKDIKEFKVFLILLSSCRLVITLAKTMYNFIIHFYRRNLELNTMKMLGSVCNLTAI